ncbi:MAG: helix-turn-helix domain-containing protein [Anaerolineales bacterium]
MNRKKFGKLLIALRREHLDGNLKAWTRQRFSEESGIDEEILANIETGRKTNLYPEQLITIADTLSLASGERRAFLQAASGVEEHEIFAAQRPEKARDELLKLMDNLQQPAFLLDQFFDIVAVNQMALEVCNLRVSDFLQEPNRPILRLNLMRLLFSVEFAAQRAMFGKHWDSFVNSVMLAFRAASLPYRATDYFQDLFQRLYEFDDFKIYFRASRKFKNDYYADNNARLILENAKLGALDCMSSAVTAATIDGDLRLFILFPLNKETAAAFFSLSGEQNYLFQTLPNWPQKPELEKK